MKKLFVLLLCILISIVFITSCSKNASIREKSAEEEQEITKEKVVVACWGNQMLDTYTSYLCEKFPQVEFEFVLATNSTDYYRFRQDHDDMPDILTVRRFALKDAVLLKDYLYDLSNTELASKYYGS